MSASAERSLDREMFDAYLTVLETVNPEEAKALEAAYEQSTSAADDEEIAGMIIECLEEAGLPIEPA